MENWVVPKELRADKARILLPSFPLILISCCFSSLQLIQQNFPVHCPAELLLSSDLRLHQTILRDLSGSRAASLIHAKAQSSLHAAQHRNKQSAKLTQVNWNLFVGLCPATAENKNWTSAKTQSLLELVALGPYPTNCFFHLPFLILKMGTAWLLAM